jgi:long-chain acyl-CoA synthetase
MGVGDRVVLATADDEEVALLFAALVLNGLTAVTIDPNAGGDRARALISQAEPSLILTDRALIERWQLAGNEQVLPIGASAQSKGLLGQLRRSPGDGFLGLLEQCEPIHPPFEIPDETLAYILFTSGTTNQPKGVCISHRALFGHLESLSRVYGLSADSVILNTLMLSHADGMIQGPMLSLVNSALLLRPMKFEVSAIPELLDTIYGARVTHMVAVPTILSLILKLTSPDEDAFRGGDFKLLISCGAALESWLWESFEKKLGASIINVYGLTETVAGGIFAGEIVGAREPGAIGIPIDCEARVVGPADEDAPDDIPGELWMRGDLMMSGYFNAPELTHEVLDLEGWLHTGDIAVRGDNGLLTIIGRKKNIVIRGGYNIHPEEVSEVLAQHPQVQDAVTFGLPDEDWGERLVSVVGSANATERGLIQFAVERLEPRKIPSRIVVVEEVPKGRSGKPVLEDVRALFDAIEARGKVAGAAAEQNVEQRLLAVAERCFRTDRSTLTLNSSPHDLLGWDSMAHMEFVISLEDEFQVKLTPREVISIDRLDKALALVTRPTSNQAG